MSRPCPHCAAPDMDAAAASGTCGYPATLPSDAAREEYRRSGADAPCECDIGWEETLAWHRARERRDGVFVLWVIALILVCVVLPPLAWLLVAAVAVPVTLVLGLLVLEALL